MSDSGPARNEPDAQFRISWRRVEDSAGAVMEWGPNQFG